MKISCLQIIFSYFLFSIPRINHSLCLAQKTARVHCFWWVCYVNQHHQLLRAWILQNNVEGLISWQWAPWSELCWKISEKYKNLFHFHHLNRCQVWPNKTKCGHVTFQFITNHFKQNWLTLIYWSLPSKLYSFNTSKVDINQADYIHL